MCPKVFICSEVWLFRVFCGSFFVPLFGKEGIGEILRKQEPFKSPLPPFTKGGNEESPFT
jgi:hypothetical protein